MYAPQLLNTECLFSLQLYLCIAIITIKITFYCNLMFERFYSLQESCSSYIDPYSTFGTSVHLVSFWARERNNTCRNLSLCLRLCHIIPGEPHINPRSTDHSIKLSQTFDTYFVYQLCGLWWHVGVVRYEQAPTCTMPIHWAIHSLCIHVISLWLYVYLHVYIAYF